MNNLPRISRKHCVAAALVVLCGSTVFLLLGDDSPDATNNDSTIDMSLRNAGYPETYISLVEVDLTSPNHWVTLTWSGPDASSQEEGPFHSSPGKGLGTNNCDDAGESNRIGSECTPKGRLVVEGFSESLSTNTAAKFATWIDMRRGVALHYFSKVPDHPASAGCIRLVKEGAQLIHNNAVAGKTIVEVGGKWTRAFDREQLRKQLIKHEGKLSAVYEDSLGIPTIGVGFNLKRDDAKEVIGAVGANFERLISGEEELNDQQIDSLLDREIEDTLKHCHVVFSKFEKLSDIRQRVLADMMFNLGPVRFRTFKKMIAAVENEDFDTAADEMKDSKWYGQVRSRAVKLVAQMRSGLDGKTVADAVDTLIVDSQMTRDEALEGLRDDCSKSIREQQELVQVEYYSFDEKLHQGQIVLDRELVSDIQLIFQIARDYRFPIGSVIPISHPKFRKDGVWDDDLSMEANNSSAFNYRETQNMRILSKHAWGRAIDINPMQNPYINQDKTQPLGASFDPAEPGTLSIDHPIVQAFIELGWEWGGTWKNEKDYQHFEKPAPPENSIRDDGQGT